MILLIVTILVIGSILIATEKYTNINKAAVAIFVGTLGWILYVCFGADFVTDDVLEKAISQLANAPDGSGELADLGLFYEKRTSDTGIARVAFADVSSANGWQTLALTLAGVGVVALAIFFVISVFFSRWALRPVKRRGSSSGSSWPTPPMS